MKKFLALVAVLLMLGFCLGGPVLADEVRGTELQLVVPEAPEPTPVPTAAPTPTPPGNTAKPSGTANPATGQSTGTKVTAGIVLAAAVLLIVRAAAPSKKKPAK